MPPADHNTLDPVPDRPPSAARVRIERQLDRLTRLADIAFDLAEAAGLRATAALQDDEADPQAAAPPAMIFDRAARAVRLTIALQSSLMADLPGIEQAEQGCERARVDAQRLRIRRAVDRAIRAECDDKGEIGSLSFEARERVGADYEDEDVLGRPADQIVARICADLGLSPQAAAWALDPFNQVAPPPRPVSDVDLDEDDDPPDIASNLAELARASQGPPFGSGRHPSG